MATVYTVLQKKCVCPDCVDREVPRHYWTRHPYTRQIKRQTSTMDWPIAEFLAGRGPRPPYYMTPEECEASRYIGVKRTDSRISVPIVEEPVDLGGESEAVTVTVTKTYFISDGELVKIGKSIDPARRLAQLEAVTGKRLKLLKIIEADMERAYHRKFRAFRVRGEWFRLKVMELL